MTQETWTAVDTYFADLLLAKDPSLEAALQRSDSAGLPAIHVSPAQGKLLHLLARLQGARTILEVGTLGGYSTIWLARALPAGGRLITLEADPKHAEVAKENIQQAGLGDIVEIRLGPALESLPQIAGAGLGPFDLIFVDADKTSTTEYFEWALKLSKVGSLVIVDNVVRNGAVIDPSSDDPNVQGVRRFNARLSAEPRVSATALQTVGIKGYDGFALALVVSGA
ncbi:O-methyltransferase [Singulisphaera rosea]